MSAKNTSTQVFSNNYPLVASIAVGGTTKLLPLLSISNVEQPVRRHVDRAIDGTTYTVAAGTGAAICALTMLDRLTSCGTPTVSAINEYKKSLKNAVNSAIYVKVMDAEGKNSLFEFSGVLTGFGVSVKSTNGTDMVVVTYNLIGDII